MKRHGKGTAVGFFDGSTHTVKAHELYELKWSRHYDPVYGANYLRNSAAGQWTF